MILKAKEEYILMRKMAYIENMSNNKYNPATSTTMMVLNIDDGGNTS